MATETALQIFDKRQSLFDLTKSVTPLFLYSLYVLL